MQGHISLEVMKCFLTCGQRHLHLHDAVVLVCSWFCIMPDWVCPIGFAWSGERLQDRSLTNMATGGIKTWDLKMGIQKNKGGIKPNTSLSREWGEKGNLSASSCSSQSKAKGWSSCKRAHPTSRQPCKPSLGLTGQGSLLPGGNQETVMMVCQNGRSPFVSKPFGIVTHCLFLPPRNRLSSLVKQAQVFFLFQSLFKHNEWLQTVLRPTIVGEAPLLPEVVIDSCMPAQCHHVNMPQRAGISTHSCQLGPVACHRQWGQGPRLEWSFSGYDKCDGTFL